MSWSRASWPFRGITGFSERKVAGAGIFYLYLGIWSGYVERGSMIFGKGLSNPSFIKHSLSSCFSVHGTGHINISQSWPLFLKGSCFSGIDRLVYSKQSSSMLCFSQKYEKVSWGPKKERDSTFGKRVRTISLNDLWTGSSRRTFHWGGNMEEGRTAWGKIGGLDENLKSSEIISLI